MLAVTVGAPPSASNKEDGLQLLAVRMIDPPSRSLASSAVGSGDGIGGQEGAEGIWRARKGGVGRGVLRRMVGMCVAKGGVGEEVLSGLEGFV